VKADTLVLDALIEKKVEGSNQRSFTPGARDFSSLGSLQQPILLLIQDVFGLDTLLNFFE
jgi:hypothetical protein